MPSYCCAASTGTLIFLSPKYSASSSEWLTLAAPSRKDILHEQLESSLFPEKSVSTFCTWKNIFCNFSYILLFTTVILDIVVIYVLNFLSFWKFLASTLHKKVAKASMLGSLFIGYECFTAQRKGTFHCMC